MSFSACAYALKCLIDPDLPVNDGFYRLVSLHAPEGTVTNCSWPGPVVGGWETHARLIEVIVRALIPAFPERLPAGTKGMMCQAGFGSLDVAAGKYTCFYDTFAGGYGGRYASDGPDAVQSHSQNTENAPIEETELNYPVRINGLSLVEDSEGPGRFRGGLGLRKDYLFDLHTTFTVLADRDKVGPWGAFGGHSGAGRRVRARPRRRRDEAQLEDDARPRARRRDQRPHLRRRRLRAARGARARAGAARRARGQGQRRAGTRGVPGRGHRPPARRGGDAGAARMSVRVAVDIGGTFTDATLIDEETGAVSIAKVLTTPADPSEGFMEAVDRALANGNVTAGQVGFVVHATTVATNAIIEGKIARGGFVTTEGFRDLLEIARQVRPSLYDTQFEKAKPLVPRDRAVTVAERLGPAGEVLRPLEDDSVRAAAAILRREEVESVAVCLLHAYVNPEHEQRVGAILAEELPGVPISLSAEVAPEFREYLRASTTVINAVIRPVVERYLERIESRLADAGVQAKLLVMQSSGGVFSSEAARSRPVFMVESGPGRRRDRLRLPRGDARPLRHPLLRHGRHDRQGRPDPGRPAVGDQGLQRRRPRRRRDRRHVALRLPGADAGRRPRRDRRGRRLDRLGRLGRPAARRPAERGRRSGAGLLPARRHRADRDGRERRARSPEPELLPRRRDRPRRRGSAPGDRGALREAARPRRHRGGERDRRDRERGDGQRAAPDLRPARLRPARLHALRLRRRGPRARERARPRRRDADAAHPPQPGHLLRHRPPHDRPEARRRGDGDANASTTWTPRRSRRRSPSSRKRVAPSWSRRASPATR